MELILATGNPGKVREMAAFLQSCLPGLVVLGLNDVGLTADIPETGDSFVANARIKAHTVAKATGKVALADDSGLCVDALGGAPGIHSARYAGEKASDADNVAKLLAAMVEVPEEARGCRFECVLVAADPQGREVIARGTWHGRVLFAPQGSGGFGYDPIFWDPELAQSAAELPLSLKNQRSHRGAALQDLARQWAAVERLLRETQG
ncbi:MAG: non-canonical purine pyrophosphatase, rdgB/HAM1 family [Desulfomicrobiaceae bacterium]|jgi:XTP/dITP diphosphohydrolase|nr:non-canonical purine pyrophosphatase, rdgB/HAM1 family [Desulfomicrobiaceae bacterium]MBZ4685712.1 non-canonical purine pyrophosphatase, rdgB/HAM1 family [Desulfomicrobiaceae bacterium]MDI3493040.1 XTP/dITP diphosphohydrolase [Desulfomicrobiaceae bacterium]MDK2873214.1 XTP/dITP diphosphohydrolase [Desulfomicrobiaceae bacterium]